LGAWGDSLTAGTGGWSYPQQLSTRIGRPIRNLGIGGQTSTQITARFLADADAVGRDDVTLIWSGRNNSFAPETVKADIATMITALPDPKRYLVFSVLNGTAEPAGSVAYTTMMQLNADLAALYGDRYVDVRSHLVNLFNPAVPQDVTDHENDVPPSSLRSDALHLNTAGYAAVAARVQTAIEALQ
jgi:lysophospholipase L1-like esterase